MAHLEAHDILTDIQRGFRKLHCWMPHQLTRKGPTTSGAVCLQWLYPPKQYLRDDFFAWLEYTTANERKCMIHHALQDQARPVQNDDY